MCMLPPFASRNRMPPIEMVSSARRLLAHLQTDMIRHRRVERFIRQAGFDLDSIEPTPMAVARLVPAYTMRLIGSRGDAQPWVAVVHDRTVLAAAPATDIGADMVRTELMAASWSASIEDLREQLLDVDELSATVNQPAGIAVSLGLSLVGDTYPEFPDTHPAWGPRLAGALGDKGTRVAVSHERVGADYRAAGDPGVAGGSFLIDFGIRPASIPIVSI